MPTHPTSLKPFNPEQIRPRRATFQFDSQAPRLWFRRSSVMTQLFNGTNLFLPTFEAYMVRTIRGQLPVLQDQALRAQAGGLIGQEINHSRVHQQYNEVLCHQGYQFESYLKRVHWFFERLMPRLSLSLQLATIAGFEHLTAALSEVVLHHKILAEADPKMKTLWEWHAAEELEHKSVAFDLFQAMDGSYGRRVIGGVLGMLIVVSLMASGLLLLAAQDSNFLSLRTLSDLNKVLVTEYRLLSRTLRHLVPYFRPDFHPVQRDDQGYGEQVLSMAQDDLPLSLIRVVDSAKKN